MPLLVLWPLSAMITIDWFDRLLVGWLDGWLFVVCMDVGKQRCHTYYCVLWAAEKQERLKLCVWSECAYYFIPFSDGGIFAAMQGCHWNVSIPISRVWIVSTWVRAPRPCYRPAMGIYFIPIALFAFWLNYTYHSCLMMLLQVMHVVRKSLLGTC